MVLEDIQVISFADNILIPSCGTIDSEARIDDDCNLVAVLERFEPHHVKRNANKLKFLVPKATFKGHIIATEVYNPTLSLSKP